MLINSYLVINPAYLCVQCFGASSAAGVCVWFNIGVPKRYAQHILKLILSHFCSHTILYTAVLDPLPRGTHDVYVQVGCLVLTGGEWMFVCVGV